IPTAQARVSNYNPSAQSQQSLTDINQIQRQLEAQKIQRLIKQEKASASRRPDDRAGLRGPGAVDVRTVEAVSVKGDGFSWADAGIGAGMAIAFLLALLS